MIRANGRRLRGIVSHSFWNVQTGQAVFGYPASIMPPKTRAQKTDAVLPAAWHTLPLHYVPYLLHTGALYAQTRLAALSLPIVPRPTATRRDRKLGLDNFVHFSLAAHTPLLRDKHRRGYPHILLRFDAQIADVPGAGFVCYNAKAWRHRDAFIPITNPDEKAAFLRERQESGQVSLGGVAGSRRCACPVLRRLAYGHKRSGGMGWRSCANAAARLRADGCGFAGSVPRSVRPVRMGTVSRLRLHVRVLARFGRRDRRKRGAASIPAAAAL